MSDPATFPLSVVALDPASSRPGNRPAVAAEEDTLLRLALWLADVATETALAAAAPAASSTPGAASPRLRREAAAPAGAESAP